MRRVRLHRKNQGLARKWEELLLLSPLCYGPDHEETQVLAEFMGSLVDSYLHLGENQSSRR